MKTLLVLLSLSGSIALAQQSVEPEQALAVAAPASTDAGSACAAIQAVEFRNSVLAAHLACPRYLSADDYNAFITEGRDDIAAANNTAVKFFMSRDGSRKKFDKLDGVVMNEVALQAVQDKKFCDDVWYFKYDLAKETFAQALATQKTFSLVRCGSY